jgi:predicted double-glycine peptidase
MIVFISRAAMLCLLLLLVQLHVVEAATRVGMHLGGVYVSQNVRSISELRWDMLTRQGWDMSCGAAALSTVLTYHNGREFSEMSITLSILKNSDPDLVRQRGGFSLFDLKRFVRAVGLEGLGYGAMTLDDLDSFGIPAILPIRIHDFDHFVVFKKRFGGHVMVGDPAFGNYSIREDRFNEMWKSRIAFYVVGSEERVRMASQVKGTQSSPLSPEVMELTVPNLNYASRLVNRIPMIPLTRRNMILSP